jgi:hypothetical protein
MSSPVKQKAIVQSKRETIHPEYKTNSWKARTK